MPYEAFYDQLVGLAKSARKADPAKLEFMKTTIIKELEEKGFGKEFARLTRKVFEKGNSKGHLQATNSVIPEDLSTGKIAPPHTRLYKGEPWGGGVIIPAQIRDYLAPFLQISDPQVIEIIYAAVAVHQIHPDQALAYLMMIGPASSGKSELLMSLAQMHKWFTNGYGEKWVEQINQLTDKTFLSGLDLSKEGKPDPSLLARMHDNIIVYPEFTPMLTLREDVKKAVFSQILSIFDGHFDPRAGSGKTMSWNGHITMIAGVTGVIDKHTTLMNVIGPRFMLLRPIYPSSLEVRKKGTQRALYMQQNGIIEWQSGFYHMVNGLFLQVKDRPTPLYPEGTLMNVLSEAGAFTAQARTPVFTNHHGEVDEKNEQEQPPRIQQQLQNLSLGSALIHNRERADEPDVSIACRVAIDSMPPARRMVILRLAKGPETGMDRRELSRESPWSEDQIDVRLDELKILGMVEQKTTPSSYWTLTEMTRQRLALILLFVPDIVVQRIVEARDITEELAEINRVLDDVLKWRAKRKSLSA